MNMKTRITLVCAGCLAAAGPVAAHHSVAGQFDVRNQLTLNGVITDVDWINPHTYLYVDVENDDGTVSTWQIESAPTAMMRKAGLTSAMLMGDGSPVTIVAIPARDGTENLAWLLRIDYEAGHFYQFGAVD